MSLSVDGWHNVKGSKDKDYCKCGSRKKHWINFSGDEEWPDTCCVDGCSNPATEGLHVWQDGSKKEWIIPGCNSCNGVSSEKSFSIKYGTTLVPANRSETCEKPKTEHSKHTK